MKKQEKIERNQTNENDQIVPGISGVFEEFSLGGEDDQRDFSIAKHGDLMSLLQQPRPPLRKRDLSIDLVLYSLELNPTPPHNHDETNKIQLKREINGKRGKEYEVYLCLCVIFYQSLLNEAKDTIAFEGVGLYTEGERRKGENFIYRERKRAIYIEKVRNFIGKRIWV